jgi:predicted acylesterase/phospholipase RssA
MAPLECDLVMKGGITSGVVYPRLVAELSKTYTFRCIGGTSVGAIAAAATAAAQLGVRNDNPAAFDELAKLPTQLGSSLPGRERSMLFSLFQPQPELEGPYEVLLAGLGSRSIKQAAWRAALAGVRRFPAGALFGALPGLILFLQSWGLASLLSLVLMALGAVAGALIQGVRIFGRALPAKHFGLCSGMGDDAALTPWLERYLNQLAGKRGDEPLTFGELWAGTLRQPGEEAPAVPQGGRVIELAMMSTALNLGRPFRLPFEAREVYFVKEELEPLLPRNVIAWLVERSRPSETADQLSRASGRRFHALPDAADFPVVLAARLSLSFPILLCALPLHAVDRSLKANAAAPREATRIYFSDGGLCSNFPVHFFDHPLPSRPTFGVNLREFHPEHPNERAWLPEPLRNNRGLKNHYPPISDAPGLGSVIGFVGALLTTMQNWRDRLQLSMPGFRDRIVHISHSADEGGLNLDMPAATIEAMAASGAQAATLLANAFARRQAPDTPNAWDNHLRIRARSFVALMHGYLETISAALQRQEPPSFDDVLLDTSPPSYPFNDPDAPVQAVNLLHGLETLATELKESNIDLRADAPRPSPELRVVPRV